MNLVVGVPTAGSPAQPFIQSLRELALPERVTGFSNITVTGNFVPAQRDLIVRHALRANADYLMMIDDDIIVPPDAIAQLLSVFDADEACGIAGGLYYSRDSLRPMAVANWRPEHTTSAHTPAFERAPVVVDGVGFGCVLIRAQVFRRMSEPYFRTQIFLEERLRRARICNEDYLFCHDIGKLGLRTYLHPGVRLGHYDRAGAKSVPEAWETPEQTGRERMTVRNADGSLHLVPLEPNVRHAGERHVAASLEYVFSEEP